MPNWSDDEGRCHFDVNGVPCYQSPVGCPMHEVKQPKRKRPAATELAEERAAHLATRQELSMALAQRHVLVEAAVRATIEACVASVYQTNLQAAAKVSNVDPAPIVARVLGGGE